FFNKPPGIGQATPAHQDGHYFMLRPCHALTMWMALDPVDEENGCVRYVRGSHLNGMRPHGRTETLGFSQGITGFGTETDIRDEVPCPANPGDLLAHDALTIHRADANLSSTRLRRALGFIFYGESAREDTDAHEKYQRNLAEELKASGKIES
ncbi:MAG: phytanoyl-CoA dioxygenase family protein, partial [Opitutales bacterium]